MAPAAAVVAVLLIHAGLTYSDYFLNWGRAPETYDAFETDMTQAAALLDPRPAAHIYLSSDIYRHPTFMLLGEKVGVSRYFDAVDPGLSWFDDRGALPIPPAGQPAVYVVPSNVEPGPFVMDFLSNAGARQARTTQTGAPEMAVALDLAAGARLLAPDRPPEAFSDRLSLIGAAWERGRPTAPTLRLYWQTAGPDPAGWRGYRLQVEGRGIDGTTWQVENAFDDFRPPEWVPDGRFLTWRELGLPEGAKAAQAEVRLRLIDVESGRPLLPSGGEGEGWHTIRVNEQ